MKQKLPKELEALIHEYENARSNTDLQIAEKLKKIAECYTECTAEEHTFADAITALFCRTVVLLKKQTAAAQTAASIPFDSEVTQGMAFSDGTALRIAFYNHFRNEKKKNGGKQMQYPEIHSLDELKGDAVNPTMRDYVARIQTFTNGYLWKMPRLEEIWRYESAASPIDPILFTYKHIELILAGFETKEPTENGEKVPNKQKNNLRSALRKLNEFKQAHQNT